MVKDGAIKTACQQACPAEAITFGNILDKQAAVVQEKKSLRDYEVLGFLDTQPRTTYLAKIRNPNAAMPDAYAKPFSTTEYHPEDHHGKESLEGGGQDGEHGKQEDKN